MKRDAKIDMLAKVPLFAGFSRKQLGDVARHTDEAEYAKGAEIARQGEVGREAFVVVSGSVMVRRNGRKVASVGPGGVVGEMGIIDSEPRTADIVAEADTTVLVVGNREFKGLVDEYPTLHWKILRSLSSRLREADKKLYG